MDDGEDFESWRRASWANYPRPVLNKPPPLKGIIIGILIFGPLKGGASLIMGLHYSFSEILASR